MQPQDINEFGVFRNPYSPAGFYANETDVNPKPFYPPLMTRGNPVCDNANGYYFDPVTQSCKLVEPVWEILVVEITIHPSQYIKE